MLRRATLTLAVTQLVSWGVLFYGFSVVAPDVTAETGWSESAVAGAFAVGLGLAGIAAPPVARALAAHDPRHVLAGGSLLGIAGMLAFATAHHLVTLYLAWVVIGLAMAATLYEPALALLVAVDPTRRHRTVAVVTVAGGLASTVFAPICGWLAGAFGWRPAMALLGVGGGAVTLALHTLVLPPAHAHPVETRAGFEPAPPFDDRLRLLRTALLFEQAATLATTVHLVGLLVHRGVGLGVAAAALGVMGLGKVLGRLLLLGPIGRRPLDRLAAAANVVQLAGLTVPLAFSAHAALFAAMVVVGVASGMTTVLRPLIVVDLVGAGPFAAVSARLQRATTLARAAAPFVLGGAVTAIGWTGAWTISIAWFGLAAGCYAALPRCARRNARVRAHASGAAAGW